MQENKRANFQIRQLMVFTGFALSKWSLPFAAANFEQNYFPEIMSASENIASSLLNLSNDLKGMKKEVTKTMKTNDWILVYWIDMNQFKVMSAERVPAMLRKKVQ